jgi:hypothetical protein
MTPAGVEFIDGNGDSPAASAAKQEVNAACGQPLPAMLPKRHSKPHLKLAHSMPLAHCSPARGWIMVRRMSRAGEF